MRGSLRASPSSFCRTLFKFMSHFANFPTDEFSPNEAPENCYSFLHFLSLSRSLWPFWIHWHAKNKRMLCNAERRRNGERNKDFSIHSEVLICWKVVTHLTDRYILSFLTQSTEVFASSLPFIQYPFTLKASPQDFGMNSMVSWLWTVFQQRVGKLVKISL